MITLWIGFILGFVFFPILYAIIPGFFGIHKAKHTFSRTKRPNLPISQKLKEEIKKGLVLTESLAWVNVVIQRIYFDSIRNYNFEHKIRQSIMRNFASVMGEGLLRSVKITGLNFGFEAPYLKSIRLITLDEYNRISENGKSDLKLCNDEVVSKDIKQGNSIYSNRMINFSSMSNINDNIDEKLNIKSLDDILEDKEQSENNILLKCPEFDKDCGHGEISSINGLQREIQFEFNQSNHFDNIKHQEIYRNVTLLGNLEYNGAIQMMIEIELPKGIHVNSIITLKKLQSDFLFRTPAVGYNTRYEVTLINSPEIEIDVCSGLVTGDRKLYFQNSISSFLRRTAFNSLKSMFFYPSWFQAISPMVPSGRSCEFIPRQIMMDNIEEAEAEFEKILLIINCDYKILDIKNDVVHRKTYSMINNVDYVNSWSFKLPKGTATSHRDGFSLYEGLSVYESKVLYSFETLEIFKSILANIKEVKVIHKKKSISLIRIVMKNYELDLVRMVYKNSLMFFKNGSKYSEFLAFKIQDEELHLFSFSNKSSDLFINSKRVIKLKKAIENPSEQSRLNQSITDSFLPTETSEVSDTESKILGIEELFKEALSSEIDSFNIFDITFQLKKSVLHRILLDDSLRMKNFNESAKIISSQYQSEKIRSFVVEYPVNDEKECVKIYSFFSKGYVIDLCPEKSGVFIHNLIKVKSKKTKENDTRKFNEAPNSLAMVESDTNEFDSSQKLLKSIKSSKLENSTKLHILYKSLSTVVFPNFFIEVIKIKSSFLKYFNLADKIEYKHSRNELKIESYVKKGTIFLQFMTEIEDDFSLSIFSCKTQLIVFEIYKIISSKEFTLIYPVDNDYIKIGIVSKHRKNISIDYKFINFEYDKDIYLNGRIGLDNNHKLKIKIEGTPSHVIFWEKNFGIPLKCYIQDSEEKNLIGECGVLRSEDREYLLVFKNKKEKKRNIDIFAGLAEFY
ncbi:uncharacterized protein VICG_00598 [Vittaforma corneae ATCC 50505]|uniref:SMP-LTD domain-containing protein n=1 Tax=Vittaforma corneae (strain ATCC 50505) TaxID=993615 RepID=L2GPF3_VITCO|nr:uncharacterized protein VICG_00598 [Vittaforma corneae ATCC 50505]ELA42499.1 hypothetical protein VICG_00598 [Vittaforma corneae ATCC 50505]